MRCLKARTQFGFCKRSFSPCPSPAAHMGYNVCSNDHNGTKWQAGQKAQGCVSPDSEQHRETLSASLSTLSACPIPLLVNMHASNTHKNTRPRAFDSLLCRVLYYAMMEWHSASPEKQNRRAREARTSRHASLSGFYKKKKKCGFIFRTVSQPNYQPEFNKNPTPRQQIHPGRLFHLVDNLRLISYFPSLCGCIEWSTSNPVRASRDIKTRRRRRRKKNLEQKGSFVWPTRAQPVVEHKTFQCGTNWVCVAHKSSSPPETQFCK